MLARLRSLHGRHKKAVDRLEALEQERAELYLEARAMTPPITFKSIAAIFEVTEAAIMQKLRRERESNGEATRKPRGKASV
jgi:hypothetical protein